MRPIGVLLAAVLVLLTACSPTVEGTARRPDPSDRASLQHLLPSPEEVSAVVGNPLDAVRAPTVGSIDVLPNGIRTSAGATPLDCLGAVTPLMRVVYESGGVRGAAWRDYARFGAGMTVSSAEAGVVQFDSQDEASRMFTRFVTQWMSCEGTTVRFHTGGSGGLDLTISGVRVDGPVVWATVLSDAGDGTVYPTEHAAGVAADCIVDVDVAVTDPQPSQRIATTRARDLVRLMLEKIAAR